MDAHDRTIINVSIAILFAAAVFGVAAKIFLG